ncbi:MAG: Tex family protein [Acidobacteria bacterium]|nr:Tex family protein [Acidobacteriota bacterium]
MDPIVVRIAAELAVNPSQVEAAASLLDGGATVPFIARYRKEATGGLDDTHLRHLDERLHYLRELEDRRTAILQSVGGQGKLTTELEAGIRRAETKTALEDLYLPYRPKRRTKATIAREAGLEPLADLLLADPSVGPEQRAGAFVDPGKGVADVAAALEGARWIVAERFSEDAALVGSLRQYLWDHAEIASRVVDGKHEEGAKFSDYFSARERFRTIPSHRALALLRGRNDGILRLGMALPEDEEARQASRLPVTPELMIGRRYGISMEPRQAGPPGEAWRRETVRAAWAVKISDHLETDLMATVRDAAEREAIRVFGRNLRDLLLAAPAGARPTLGLDPGLRTGVKVAAVDATGKLVDTATIYPHAPRNDWDQSIAVLAALVERHRIELISIGNGTASRETVRLVSDLLGRHPAITAHKVVVSEAGASVYSASELAAREFPGLDVSLRGAVSIARRLQDPLAELVKIEPKAIGVGQYQHDVSQPALARALDAVVEDCVNAVGADVNTASPALLARISGLNERLATNLVAYRDEHGAFQSRNDLKKVPRFGDKTFEQAAGFLRIRNGRHPLDASGVHPEAYPVVQRIVQAAGKPIHAIIGDASLLRGLTPETFVDDRFGMPTVKDILAELEKPGRDPRPGFRTAAFRDGVEDLKDLEPGMTLEGTVTNVTNFGAFVDIGVHQDGLVHVSQLADRFVKDPSEVVKAGDIVKVTVVEVDLKRRRVALSMKSGQPVPTRAGEAVPARNAGPAPLPGPTPPARPAQTSMAAAFRNLREK